MRLNNIDLIAAWNRLVERGLVKNIFEDKTGRRIEAGVRLSSRGPEEYAIDLATGKDILEPTQVKLLSSGFELHFTPIGKLKPYTPPAGLGRQADLPADPSLCRLACQDPKNPLSIARRDLVLQIALPNFEWRAFPNVAPWEPRGHIIWIPAQTKNGVTTLPHYPQILTRDFIEDFLMIVEASSNLLTFFTSLHAGASANHIHFQSVYYDHQLPVESAERKKMGRYAILEEYPANGLAFPRDVAVEDYWRVIDKVQKAGYPFNFVALATGIYFFIRHPEHEIVEEFPGRPLGAMEFTGHINTGEIIDLSRVTDAVVAAAFAKITLDSNTLYELLEG